MTVMTSSESPRSLRRSSRLGGGALGARRCSASAAAELETRGGACGTTSRGSAGSRRSRRPLLREATGSRTLRAAQGFYADGGAPEKRGSFRRTPPGVGTRSRRMSTGKPPIIPSSFDSFPSSNKNSSRNRAFAPWIVSRDRQGGLRRALRRREARRAAEANAVRRPADSKVQTGWTDRRSGVATRRRSCPRDCSHHEKKNARVQIAPEIGGALSAARACGAAWRRTTEQLGSAPSPLAELNPVYLEHQREPLREAEAGSRTLEKSAKNPKGATTGPKPKKRKDKPRADGGKAPKRKRERDSEEQAPKEEREPVSAGTRGFFFVFFFFRVHRAAASSGGPTSDERERLHSTREVPRTRTPWTPRSASSRGSPTSARTWSNILRSVDAGEAVSVAGVPDDFLRASRPLFRAARRCEPAKPPKRAPLVLAKGAHRGGSARGSLRAFEGVRGERLETSGNARK